MGRLSGLLEAATAEGEIKNRQVAELQDAQRLLRGRVEEETVSARTAAATLAERESAVIALREAAQMESEAGRLKIQECR